MVHRLADELHELDLVSNMPWTLTHRSPSPLTASTRSQRSKQDAAMETYEEAIADWNATKSLIPLARYGPFHMNEATGPAKDYQLEMARTLARALRIQTTAVVLDGMVRNEAEYDFDHVHVVLFEETGMLIRKILTPPLDFAQNKELVSELVRKVEQLRECIDKLRTSSEAEAVSRRMGLRDFEAKLLRNAKYMSESLRMDDDAGMGLPKYATGGSDNALVFLQLVEHLILRCLRLYEAWKHVELQALELRGDYPTLRSNITMMPVKDSK